MTEQPIVIVHGSDITDFKVFPSIKIETRFFAKIVTGFGYGCWLWIGARSSNGYGNFCIEGRWYGPHRLSYMYFIGPIPIGLELDHLCRNRPCVNPYHVEPVTRRENLARSPLCNTSKTHCKRGHSLEDAYVNSYGGGRACRPCTLVAAKERRQLLNA